MRDLGRLRETKTDLERDQKRQKDIETTKRDLERPNRYQKRQRKT